MTTDLTWMPAWKIRDLIVGGAVSPTEVTSHFLERIDRLDPTLRAFEAVDAEGAVQQAKALETALGRGEETGPLCGIPTSVKPGISVEGLPRMDPARPGERKIARRDDVSIERLRRAGAVIIGISSVVVDSRNPWDLARVPGVSTSGGASGAAAGLVPLTIGSDGAGSVRLPAAFTGLAGIHPSIGRIPWVDEEVPGITSLLHVAQGPLCYDVRDVATALQVMAGPHGRDIFCLQDAPEDYLSSLDDGVRGMRFAWTDDFGCSASPGPESKRVLETVRAAAGGFQDLGATVEEIDEDWEAMYDIFRVMMSAVRPEAPGDAPDPADWERALDLRARTWDRFHRMFREYDLVLSVTTQRIAPTTEVWQEDLAGVAEGRLLSDFWPRYFGHNLPFNLLRFPAITVPCGFVDGLPVGLQIGGPAGSERTVLRAAYAFAQAFPRTERPTDAA